MKTLNGMCVSGYDTLANSSALSVTRSSWLVFAHVPQVQKRSRLIATNGKGWPLSPLEGSPG